MRPEGKNVRILGLLKKKKNGPTGGPTNICKGEKPAFREREKKTG